MTTVTSRAPTAGGRWGRLRTSSFTAALVGAVAALGFASSASAAPKGDFAVFADCPSTTPNVSACLYSQTTGGEVKVGATSVPISKVITLQGGLQAAPEEETASVISRDGNTLSKTPETVPGGLLGIVAPAGWPGFLQTIFNEFINKGATGVTATTELVGTPRLNLLAVLSEAGTGLTLPVRVKLSNAFLGEGCFIGSKAAPVMLHLTSGATSPPAPNKSIHGSSGELGVLDEGEITTDSGNELVDNSFAAPAAEGCGGILSLLVDPAVDLKLGLPSPAGHNTAILTGNLELASAEAVRSHE